MVNTIAKQIETVHERVAISEKNACPNKIVDWKCKHYTFKWENGDFQKLVIN